MSCGVFDSCKSSIISPFSNIGDLNPKVVGIALKYCRLVAGVLQSINNLNNRSGNAGERSCSL
jgi:hypothetical protein